VAVHVLRHLHGRMTELSRKPEDRRSVFQRDPRVRVPEAVPRPLLAGRPNAVDASPFHGRVENPPAEGRGGQRPGASREQQNVLSGPTALAPPLRVLGAMFNVAVRRGYCPRNPIDRLDDSHRPQAEKREAAYFTDDELPKLLSQLDGLHRVVVLLALKTGMREGEIARLTWGDVDTVNSLIRVRDGKTKAAVREVDLTPDVVELLGHRCTSRQRHQDEINRRDREAFLLATNPIRRQSDGRYYVQDAEVEWTSFENEEQARRYILSPYRVKRTRLLKEAKARQRVGRARLDPGTY
jgi:integrase